MKQLTPNEFIEQTQNALFSDIPEIECCLSNIENCWLKKTLMPYDTAFSLKEEIQIIRKLIRKHKENIVNVEIKDELCQDKRK